jgi:hypothetical protein
MLLAAIVLANLIVAQPALAADRTVVKLAFSGPRNQPVEVWVTRADAEDGSLAIKLIAKGVGPRPQSLTLYSGGGGDDGPGTNDFRSVTAKVAVLPMAGKAVRVDFSYQIPGTTEEQTDSTLIGFEGKPHKLLHLTVRRTRQRNKNCATAEETALQPEGDELDGRIVAAHQLKATPALGDDDEPLDAKCVTIATEKTVYRYTGEKYVEAAEPQVSPQPSPSPMASPAPKLPDSQD